ncbi:high-affinity nickel-transporter [Pseudarthrobacter chlorophenolicus A6]|uniref:Nickel/cobalt efflux system n=1 Tax=Pseudarthrobacter chlorophenolicus (strain ATCC 700700 / DSM 12829 / CIP 107037 / JCM 12360 / KCTC 9906 / NCIMB 13794 / A6) TaxID=452863 RepID=B8HA12_PSECP|nr:nickel transporter [Pseudarthrobacter chlorophenolicus]ACL38396.1 high-affinity nickel-transporter [Pseudarthrobacter chlorophenolicus A6]SDQ49603.1 high-affinity nickel-transport protein [Pseudarthrobacter chlorophenolicus]
MTALANIATLYRDRETLPFRTRLLATFGAVAALHVAAVVLLVAGSATAGAPLALGLVLTAYVAGVKHSYDWDHIAAIDNSTRKFVAQRKDPVSVGFAFSLGHSSVVVLAGLLVVAGAAVIGQFMEEGTTGNHVLGLIGSGVSGLFLLAMGLFNGSAFLRAAQVYRRVQDGAAVRDEDLDSKGFVARLLARPLARVQRPRNIYVIGFLFGLGFDTATTIGLLVTTTAASLAGVSPVALMALPLAFTAAMTLCDTVNGVAMMRMYRSAIHSPQRRLGFNAVVTGVSALSALFIAVITLGGFANAAFGLGDPLTSWLGEIDLGEAGLLLVAAFLAVWGGAALASRQPRNN